MPQDPGVKPSSSEPPKEDTTSEPPESLTGREHLLEDDGLRKLVETYSSEETDEIDEPTIHSEDEPKEPDAAKPTEPTGESTETKGEGDDEGGGDAPKPDPEPKPKEPTDPDPDDNSYPDEDEISGYTPNSQKRIRQLVAARRRLEDQLDDAKQKASYAEQLESRLEKAGLSSASWDNWTKLGFLVQSDPAKAAEALHKMAVNLGYQPEAPAAKPKGGDGGGATALDDDLQQAVDSYQMTADMAKKFQAERNQRKAPTEPPKSPASPSTQPGESFSAPSLSQRDMEYGTAEVEKVDAEYRAKYPSEWDSMVDDVQAELTRMVKELNIPPARWGRTAREAAEKILSKRKGSGSPSPDPVLRAGPGQKRKPGPDPTTREGLAEAITSGKFFSR